jgi:hypothetical protein
MTMRKRGAPAWTGACLAGLLAAPVLFAVPARADVRTIAGNSLAMTLTTDQEVSVEPDASLTGQVRLVSDNTGCLDASAHGGEVQVLTAACDSDSGKLTVMVPPGFAVTMLIAGSGNVHVGDLTGALKATLSSDGDLVAGHSGPVQLAIRGSGDATLRGVAGPAEIDVSGSGTVKLMRLNGSLHYSQHGSGDLAISHIEAPSAQIESAGSGDIAILGGHVAALQVRLYGSGDMAMSGSVDTADLEATGGGDIRIAGVTGTVRRSAHGGSSISVGASDAAGSSAMRRLSKSLSDSDDGDDDDGVNITLNHNTGGFGHVVAGVVVLGLLIGVWRTVMRNGGPAAFRQRFGGGGVVAPPRDPGVIALCDLLAGLEKRLARVEIHVTSKEFDLNRKFREMGAEQK